MDDYERVLLVKPDVHVYRIPPRVTNRAYRASDWNLDTPDWNCRLRLIAKGDSCFIKLDEKSTGQFFGQCPIEKYPGTAVETVSDSSRYFVLRLVNEQTKRTAFVGIGFVDRSDSFDLNVALQDHFKIIQSEKNDSTLDVEENKTKLDLKFKEGETIKVNLNLGSKLTSKPRPKPSINNKLGLGGVLLPPPPSGKISTPHSTLEQVESTKKIETSKQQPTFEEKLFDDLNTLSISEDIFAQNGCSAGETGNSFSTNDDWHNFVDSKILPTTTKTETFSADNENSDDYFWSNIKSNTESATNAAPTNFITGSEANESSSKQFDDWAQFS